MTKKNGRQRTTMSAFVIGSLVGSLAGAATALLLAPQSGEETKAKIRESGVRLKKETESKIEEGRLAAEENVSNARLRLADWLRQTSSTLNQKADDIAYDGEGKEGKVEVEKV